MIEEKLTNEGWKYIGKCNCNLTLNIKYQKEDYIIYYMPKRRQFYVKQYNHKIISITDIKELDAKLHGLCKKDTVT